MIYTLYLWTVVAMAGDRFHQNRTLDWRPIGEFASKELCEDGGCVRSK
jgi:hypothetical protein